MSEQQLKRALTERDKANDELQSLGSIIKVSAACEKLVKFVKETSDPLSPDFTGENPWHQKGTPGPCCTIL